MKKEFLRNWDKELIIELERLDSDPNYSFQFERSDGTYFSKEDSYKLIHCCLCNNFPNVDMSFLWCKARCKYYTEALSRKNTEKIV